MKKISEITNNFILAICGKSGVEYVIHTNCKYDGLTFATEECAKAMCDDLKQGGYTATYTIEK